MNELATLQIPHTHEDKRFWLILLTTQTVLSTVAFLLVAFKAPIPLLEVLSSHDKQMVHNLASIASLMAFLVIAQACIYAYLENRHTKDALISLLCELSLIGLLLLLSWFPSDFTFVAQTFLDSAMVVVTVLSVKHVTEERAMIQALKYIRNQATKQIQSQPVVKKSIQQCSLCHQKSPYDICLSCEKKYQKERQRVRSQILRAKLAHVEATLTLSQWLTTLARFHRRCAYCQTGPYEVMEHYIPISQGGGTTAENCVPACRKCNAQKSDRHPESI